MTEHDWTDIIRAAMVEAHLDQTTLAQWLLVIQTMTTLEWDAIAERVHADGVPTFH